jgi:hypothetical protein
MLRTARRGPEREAAAVGADGDDQPQLGFAY